MSFPHALQFLAAGLFPLSVVAADSTQAFDPQAFLWKQRLLLVFAPKQDHPAVEKQVALWKDAGPEASERDLRMILWRGAEELPPAAKENYDIDPNMFAVLLVGKDGGVKLRSREPVEPDRIFTLIDSMPMRRDEMRKAAAK